MVAHRGSGARATSRRSGRRLTEGDVVDIYCKRCGEPWDMDEIHEEISARLRAGALDADAPYEAHYSTVKREFFRLGCGAFTDVVGEGYVCADTGSARAHVAAVLYDAFGHDLDGVASDLADAEYLGVFR